MNYTTTMTTTVAVLSLVLLTLTSAAAQGPGFGQGSFTDHPYEEVALELTDLTDGERSLLTFAEQEERLAHDVYATMYELYQLPIFNHIAQSEEQHMNTISSLMDAYGMGYTTGYGDLQSTYDALIAKGQQSLASALDVGKTIENLDIADINEALLQTENTVITRVLQNLKRGSERHLAAFERQIEGSQASVSQRSQGQQGQKRGKIRAQ